MRHVRVGSRTIGHGYPTYIIAEAGVNHLGDIERAKSLIQSAKEAGTDAIKFQTYKADKLALPDAPRFWDWEGEVEPNGSQFDSYSRLDKMERPEYEEICAQCSRIGIEFLSTPFDEDSADMLDEIGIRAFKIASCDITNHPLLSHVAKKAKPIILSTGASTPEEIESAIEVIQLEGNNDIVLLHCILAYPTKNEDANLQFIEVLKRRFKEYPIGFSDHTIGTTIPSYAVAFGACVIEKHFTLDKELPLSADHWLSLDPTELSDMVEKIRFTEIIGGLLHRDDGTDGRPILESENIARKYARRKIVARKRIKAGELFTKNNLICKRPGDGISPNMISSLIGRTSKRDIQINEPIILDDL